MKGFSQYIGDFRSGCWKVKAIIVVLSCLIVPLSNLRAAIPNVPPEIISQLKSMSPSEQAKLARQYGFDLPNSPSSARAGGQRMSIGAPGEQLAVPEEEESQNRDETDEETQAEEEPESVELSRFGIELFDKKFITFSPVDDLPAPENYSLGPGDSLILYMYGNDESELQISVDRDGTLVIPRLGPISVVGMTFQEAKALIKARIKERLIGTEAVVSLEKLRSINVFIAGEVAVPGGYSVSALTTVSQALYLAQGITSLGSLREVTVKRGGATVATFDAYDVLLRGDTSNDVRLRSGDTVFVPTVKSLVAVDGQVKRPAIYESRKGDTVADVLAMAGGLTSLGFGKTVSFERRGTGGLTRLRVDLSNQADLALEIRDGDSIEIPSIKEEALNQVTLRGAVARPGGYAWQSGLRLSDLISNVDEDLLSGTDLSTGLIVRRRPESRDIFTIALDLARAMDSPGSESDELLQAHDEVLVFGFPYLEEEYTSSADRERKKEIESVLERMARNDLSKESARLRGIRERSEDADQKLSMPLEPRIEQDSVEPPYESRTKLISEVVARLQAQAEMPSSTKVVEVKGDVRLPGKYPLPENGSIPQLVNLAGGFESTAFLEFVEITRTTLGKEGRAQGSSFKVLLGAPNSAETFELAALDTVQILKIPDLSFEGTVSVSGSVVFPGEYSIVRGEKLSSVLSRAGGVTKSGFVEGAKLTKLAAQKREREQAEELVARIQRDLLARSRTREDEESGLMDSEKMYVEFLKEVLEEEVSGRVVIDLAAILGGDASADIQLEAGDAIFVPEFSNTISVIGEVRQQGTFRFEADRSVIDYLDLAAGTTARAARSDTYIVRANGSVEMIAAKQPWLSFRASNESTLLPGDTIVVPVNEDYQPTLARYKEVSTVIFQSVASLYPLFRF